MEADWAVKNLQVIRTLMERGAVYRRALAPVMSAVGGTGMAAAALAAGIHVHTAGAFAAFWMAVAFICLIEAFWLIRRQALKDSEPFWSPPTRRIVQALSPAFMTGFVAGLVFLGMEPPGLLAIWLLVPGWMVLYGCGLHAGGFFMPRGVRLFGWVFVGAGCVFGAVLCLGNPPAVAGVNWAMGGAFGVSHLAYGIYLYFTEKGGNAT